ncbi:OmpA family protein [Spirosoma flavum]|uniref:OmpA family protein n=1 Tax=Spirosoma flavum TaxID=2048557 RepID=A0ABW6ANT4_9BACT
MNWTKYVLFAGCLCLSDLASTTVWGQPKHQVAPTDGSASLEGVVQDAKTERPIAGAIVMAKNQEGTVRSQQVTNVDGTFQLRLDPKQSYIITTKANDYTALDEQLAFTSGSTNRLYGKVIRLFRSTSKPVSVATTAASSVAPSVSPTPTVSATAGQSAAGNTKNVDNSRITPPKTLDAKVIYTPPLIVAPTGKTIQLQAVQFVQSKSELLPDAQPALEQLLQFMQGKPTAEIELSGHTDNQGDFDQNLLLSKQRVDVVKDYLVKNGIVANRITTRGYGPTRPIASNNSEATRKLNRRVEMIVVKQ